MEHLEGNKVGQLKYNPLAYTISTDTFLCVALDTLLHVKRPPEEDNKKSNNLNLA
jgi:hypothetical protein